MVIESYLNHIKYEKKYSSHTLKAYQRDLIQFSEYLLFEYEQEELLTTTPVQIRSWVVKLVTLGHQSRTIHRKISTLKSFYNFHQRQGNITANPAKTVTLPKKSKAKPQYINEQQLTTLFHDVEFEDSYEGLRDRLILDLLYSTGMRRSELLNLKLTDFNAQQHQLKVLGKGNKERLIPLSMKLSGQMTAFVEVRNDCFSTDASHFFLTNKGQPLYPKAVYNIVQKYLSLVTTAQKRSPHTLRHSFATHVLANGGDLKAIQDILGHSSLAATQVYTHNSLEKLKEIYKKAHPKGE